MPRRERHLLLERLEDLTLPAVYGIPWQDPTNITLSFPADGTAIAGHVSGLEGAMDAQGLANYRRTILTAFQSWAAFANLDFGFQADGGLAFGTAGLAQGDPRFGDIRVGGQSMSPEVLAVAVPPDPSLSGTWAGDVLFNTDYAFDGSPYSLLAVAMHEAGHALGLSNSATADSVMFTTYTQTRTTLSAQDIARIRALYGTRTADSYEGAANNNAIARASNLRRPAGYVGDTPLVAFGDLHTFGDADTYRVTFPPDGNEDEDDNNQGAMTIRLQTSGRSLMMPRLSVFDSFGNRLAVRTSTSIEGDTLQVSLNGLSTAGTYFVRVESSTRGVFGVGSYGLSVRYDNKSSTPDTVIDSLIRGPYARLGPAAIDAFFRTGGDTLVNADARLDDTLSTARLPAASSGNTRWEAIASIAMREDVDSYRVVAPAGRSVLTFTAFTADGSGFEPSLRVFDHMGQTIAARVLSAGNGTYAAQIDGVVAGRSYYVQVRAAAAATEDKGNYQLSAVFSTASTPLRTFASGSLSSANIDESSRLYVAETQLFHAVLSAGSADPGARVRMTLTDGNGATALDITAFAGTSASSGAVLLTPGAYTARFEVINPNGAVVTYVLRGATVSNPIGPVLSDPTLSPQYKTPPTASLPPYTYPGFAVPYDPSFYSGYFVPASGAAYPWGVRTNDPLYWIALGY